MSGSCALLGLPMRCYAPELARLLGEGPATLLQTLHWRLLQSPHTLGGLTWVYDTYDAWQRDWFPHWSTRTVKRHVETLRQRGVVLTRKDLNAHGYDTTTWYTIDYDALRRLDGLPGFVAERSDNLTPPETQGHRPKGQSGTSSMWPKGQSGTDETLRLPNPEQDTLPEQDDAPDGEEEVSAGCPPPAAALSVGAAQPEGTEPVEDGEPPAPEHHPVSAPPTAEAAPTSGAPAELLAASPGGGARGTRANSACARAAPPPEFGHTYRLAWEDGPLEVGHALDERGVRYLSPGFVATLTTRYAEEFAYAGG